MSKIIDEYLSILDSIRSHLEDIREFGYSEIGSSRAVESSSRAAHREESKPRQTVPPKPFAIRADLAGKPVGSTIVIPPNQPSLFGDSGGSEADELAGCDMEELKERVSSCRKCQLCETRTNTVFGVGDENATLMFVGEAPGRDEDLQGLPFVGRAGQLLTRIIEAIDLTRDQVYIANVLKCRPPNNRDPLPEEVALCQPYLLRQIDIIRPRIICALGRYAAQTLLDTKQPLSRLRGQFHSFRGIDLIVTYHPASLLRNPAQKRPTWEDMQMLRARYDQVKKR